MRSPAIPVLTALFAVVALSHSASAETFRRLTPLPAPKITAFTEERPGGNFLVGRIIDGNPKTEYVGNSKGTATFIEFDFGAPVAIGAFRHQDRNDAATIAASELTFFDEAGRTIATIPVTHVNQRAGVTSFALPQPITARKVRWHITKVGSQYSTVGGAEIQFFAAGDAEPQPRATAVTGRAVGVIENRNGARVQPLHVTVEYPYQTPAHAVLHVAGQPDRPVDLKFGPQTLEYSIPAEPRARTLPVSVSLGSTTVSESTLQLPPVRPLTVYVLPHSHTDIGYTAIQTDIEEKQINNLKLGLAAARRTASYPEGSRFVWNVEVLWAADLFLQRLPAADRAEFFDAVKNGQVALNGMYLNELTGLCRPEELVRLFRFATQLGTQTGVPVDSAMISDVPGYTWGTVTAMAQSGVRYFSVAPNYFDRIGNILVEWENKPFWWVAPDGVSKVLVWIPYQGYGMSHRYGQMSPRFVEEFCDALETRGYPYDIAYVRWAGHGDNAVPDPAICEFIKDWNATHESPRFVISSTSQAFRAFEQKYGAQLPQVRGDWTPYWEDGAASSAAETALNRVTSDRLTQAETLWAMLDRQRFPAAAFEDAWRNVLLYSEHTWGAFCSITEPANPFTLDQWTIKQAYATTANGESRQLLGNAALALPQATPRAENEPNRVDLYNTQSWPRSGLVLIPRELSTMGAFVTDERGEPVPAQRLANRDLAVWINELPPFSGRRYFVGKEGRRTTPPKLTVTNTSIDNGRVRVEVDPKTGGITTLRANGIATNLADTASGHALNDYLYLIGDDVRKLQTNGPVTIRVRDRGPLVASLLVESDAPGCFKLSREIRVTAGADYVELLDTIDKKRLEATDYKSTEGKESVNLAFPFNVPAGEMKLDVPLGVIRPEQDQMASACKNWLTLGRWADVSNRDFGVTLVTLDTPLVQVGGITATLLNSQTNPDVWRKKIEPTQQLYVWAMNNHWGTNYRAYQEGPVTFRFVLRPHRGPAQEAENARFATGFTQPVVALPGRGAPPKTEPLLRVEPATVLVSGLKPSDDGKAWIVRLFGASDAVANAKLTWSGAKPPRLYESDTSETAHKEITGDIAVAPHALVTVRAEPGK